LPRGLIIALLCLALVVPLMPAAAAPSPAPCAAMAAMPGGHGALPGPDGCCRARQTGRCCLEEVPTDCRPLAHAPAHRLAAPALTWGAPLALIPRLASRALDAPLARARAPVPLYLSHASLLI